MHKWQKWKQGRAKKRAAKDALNFLPSALEIQTKPPHPFFHRFLWLVILLIIFFILWASLGQIDVVVTGEGKIIPIEQVKKIQPLEKGSIAKILVKNGELVHKGAALIALDQSLTKAEIRHLVKRLKTYKMRLEENTLFYTLLKSYPLSSLSFHTFREKLQANLAQPHEQSLRLVWRKWQAYVADIKALKAEIAKTESELQGAKSHVKMLETTLPIIREQTAMLAQLHQKNYASKSEYLKSRQTLIEKEQALEIAKASRNELSSKLSAIVSKLEAQKANYFVQTLRAIQESDIEINTIENTLNKQRILEDKQILTAPITGYVHDLKVHTIGAVVTPAEVLLQIIPKTSAFEVAASIPNRDIGYIQEGQSTMIKVETYPFTEYGYLQGHIRDISDDAVSDNIKGLIFKVNVSITEPFLKRLSDGKKVKISPGMSAQIEIKTHKRAIIAYFLSPLIRGFKESFKER